MFMIDVVLKNTPSILSVQRKAAEDAEAVYKQISEAIANGTPKVLELTCEKETSKRVTLVVGEVIAVQMSDKSGAGSASRAPGFFALTAGE